MTTTTNMSRVGFDDAQLVAASLAGNAEAFGQIVFRYQNLICSITYSATGSLSQSEDLAQEVFLAAWKELRQLREPEKLRAWLCGIARRLIANTRRRQGREPAWAAASLDDVETPPAPEPLPPDRAITQEEEGILWRSLESIPELYREPLVLFYRQGQSVEQVADALELSADAVKQRLSRGRRLLQEQVARFVEGALRQTAPGRAFTLGVLAALPVFASSATAATVGATAVKGSAAANAAGLAGLAGAIIGPLVGLLGAWIGMKASIESARSPRERELLVRQARWTVAFVLGFLVLFGGAIWFTVHRWQTQPVLALALMVGLPLVYVVMLFALVFRFQRDLRRVREEAEGRPGYVEDPRLARAWETYEYRSRRTFLGLPLVHVRSGRRRGEKLRPALGWIAVGDVAVGGVLSLGGIAVGGISLGGLSLGLLAFGGMAAGGLAGGGVAVGLWAAFGGLAIGYLAFGGCALGWHAAMGGFAAAHEYAVGGAALGAHANDAAARQAVKTLPFFRWAHDTTRQSVWFSLVCWLPMMLLLWQALRARRRLRQSDGGN